MVDDKMIEIAICSFPTSIEGEDSSRRCRICHESENYDHVPNQDLIEDQNQKEDLIAPCKCTGSMAWVHPSCLQQWLTISNLTNCEVCCHGYETIVKRPHLVQYVKYCGNPQSVMIHVAAIFSTFWTSFLIPSVVCNGSHTYRHSINPLKYTVAYITFMTVFCIIVCGGVIFIWWKVFV